MNPGKKPSSLALKLSRTATFALVVLSLLPSIVHAQQSTTPKRVLVLYWYDKDFPANVRFERSFHTVLQSAPAVEYYSEYMEDNRFPKEHQSQLLRDYLRQKYVDRPIDVVVTNGYVPMDFLLKYRQELFPHAPIVFLQLTRPTAEELVAGPGITGVIIINSHRQTLDLALNYHPRTEQVFVVSGTLEHDKRYETIAREELQAYEGRVRINYLTDLPPDELIARMKSLPERSIVLYVWQQSQNVQGKVLEAADVLALMAQSAPVPIYGMIDKHVGSGIVGGYVYTIETSATRLAEMALQIVNGARAQDIPVERAPSVPMFDWRQLRRWGISEDSLPPDSIIRFKEFTFWELYKGRIIVVFAILMLQTLLLVGLLFERAKKRRATHRLAESEQRFAKAFKANPQPMSITTLAEGRYLDVNESFLAMTGFTREEVIGHTSNQLRNYENASDREKLLIEPLLRSGVARNFELKFRTKNGAFRTLLSSAELLELAGEKCILIASSDISERKTLEQELQRSEREFSTLVENSPDIIARLDPDLRYIYISPGLERATGVSTDRFIGKTALEVALDGYDSQSFEATCREAINTRQAAARAFSFGGRNYWTRVVPEFAGDGTVESVMTISEDVTDRIRAQEELLQLTAQLFRSQDEERRRIARELHDGTAQNLFGISINLAKLSQLSHDKPEARRLIDECESLGKESLQEIRTLSYLLHPPLLDEVGLVSALQWYVQGFTKRSGIFVDLVAQPMDRLPADVELALFRIVQESLTNVRRHSGSETASIRLENTSDAIVLEIQDRGRGMSTAEISDDADDIIEMGVGIPGMRQRLLQLGGRLEVTSNSHGVAITAVVPLTNGAYHVANPSRGRS